MQTKYPNKIFKQNIQTKYLKAKELIQGKPNGEQMHMDVYPNRPMSFFGGIKYIPELIISESIIFSLYNVTEQANIKEKIDVKGYIERRA